MFHVLCFIPTIPSSMDLIDYTCAIDDNIEGRTSEHVDKYKIIQHKTGIKYNNIAALQRVLKDDFLVTSKHSKHSKHS